MTRLTRLRAAVVDALLWTAVLDGLLWLLTCLDVTVPDPRSTGSSPVPDGIGLMSAASAVLLLAVALPGAAAWWRGRPQARGRVAGTGVAVLATSVGWINVPQVGWLAWAGLAVGVGLLASTLPGLWVTVDHLGIGRRRWLRWTAVVALFAVAILVAPNAGTGIGLGLVRQHVAGQPGWPFVLPAVATIFGALMLGAQLLRGRPEPAWSRAERPATRQRELVSTGSTNS